MQTIGERLLDARQRRGVSIREAAEATKVRGDYLAAMEANQFDSIPLADVYRRGFLKIYARFLRLDSDRIVGDFNALLAARNPVAPRGRRGEFTEPVRSIEMREAEGLDEFSSGAIETAARPDARRQLIIIGAGILSLAVIGGLAIKGCSSSESAAKTSAAAADANAGEVVFSSKLDKPVWVWVTLAPAYQSAPEGREVFRELIPARGTVIMRQSGDFVVHSLDPIDFVINGGSPGTFQAGYHAARIKVSPKGR